MLKMLFSSIFNIKMATQKFINFDVFLKMHADMTAVTHNLTKLLRMKLKTTKCYQSHLTEKKERTFWPTQ